MTTKQCTITLTHSVEFTKEATFDLDVEAFEKWKEGRVQGYDDPFDPVLIKTFIEEHPDREEIEDAMHAMGKLVSTDSDGFTNIQKVVVP